jgi:hypothetical protein
MPQFLDGLHNQRSSMGYRVRTEALQYIVDDVKLFAMSASRFGAFSELIGYKPATKTSQAFYERFEVPLLYDKWDGTINVNGLFRGNAALEVRSSPRLFLHRIFLILFFREGLRFLHPRASRREWVV